MHPKRFHDYNTFLKRKFGCKVYKISVNAGFTCPNLDGKVGYGGCIYCNNDSFNPMSPELSIPEQIAIGMKIRKGNFHAKKFLVYFQPHTNTYAPVDRLRKVYDQALSHPDVVGLAIGTRPDEVNPEKIRLLEKLAKSFFISIEYGVQTKNDRTLEWINRRHTYQDFLNAMEMTRGRGIHICAHIMLGFPGETREQMLEMAAEINRVKANAVKLHQLLITRKTRLADIYNAAPFPLFDYEDYLELVCDFLERLSPDIVVERLFATTTLAYLIAPRWRKSPGQITNDITKKLTRRDSHQGILLKLISGNS